MKKISTELKTYMDNERNFLCCDLFEIRLRNGNLYCIADFDMDISYKNKLYRHDLFLIKRNQTKTVGEPTVDTTSVTIYTDDKNEDLIENKNILLACHDGTMDKATLNLRRAYFDTDTLAILGVINLFSGRIEVNSVGGLSANLDIKSVASGLAGLYPVRIFAPQKSFTESGGTIITSSTDKTTCTIPLKPSKNVLIRV